MSFTGTCVYHRGSQNAVNVFHKPQVNIGAGLDLTVGPYGRAAQAAVGVGAAGLGTNYSYSQSKGFYAGLSLQGTVIATRKDVNTKFYSREIEASDILSGKVAQPNAARPLYEALATAQEGIAVHRVYIYIYKSSEATAPLVVYCSPKYIILPPF